MRPPSGSSDPFSRTKLDTLSDISPWVSKRPYLWQHNARCICKKMNPLPFFGCLFFALLACKHTASMAQKLNGVTLVAPRDSFAFDPMQRIHQIGAGWVAVVPYAFSTVGQARVTYDTTRMHWGERPAGVRETIRLAHAKGLKVMLKPQVYVPKSWTGNLDFDHEAAYAEWEADYERYMLLMAQIAAEKQVELLCIGTEFQILSEKRAMFWRALTQKIKKIYHGKLTYSANWTEWQRVAFWDELDYIGLSAYFPLLPDSLPQVPDLVQAWQPLRDSLARFSQRWGKPVLFSEYGYLPANGCGWRGWEIEPLMRSGQLRPNEQAQANCYEALHQVFQKEPWWAGGFVWKWFPQVNGQPKRYIWDYSPQGKVAEGVLEKWFKQ